MTKNCLKLNLFIDFKKTQFWHPQITKMSQFLRNLTSPALTPYYSYRAQVYALQVIQGYPRGPPHGNTCVSMAKMRKMIPKTSQNDKILSIFSIFSGRPKITWNDVLWRFLMSWSSGNLRNASGWFLDDSFFMIFLKFLGSVSEPWTQSQPDENE